jgi:hypothetical protein
MAFTKLVTCCIFGFWGMVWGIVITSLLSLQFIPSDPSEPSKSATECAEATAGRSITGPSSKDYRFKYLY